MERIVLGYTGSLETSIAIPWLAQHAGVDVIAVTLDLGQGRELADVRERALSCGATRAHVLDVRDELAREYMLPVLQAEATGEGGVPLVTAPARPLIAKKLLEIARIEGATTIAHCCAPFSEDETRLEAAARALDSSITVVAPLRESRMTIEQRIAFAKDCNIFVPGTAAAADDVDANLWGRATRLAGNAPADGRPREDAYVLTRAPHACPEEPASLVIDFEAGVPVRANGIEMRFAELIESVETIAGAHGVGRFDVAGDGRPGTLIEAPAAVVLQTAHQHLEECTVPPELRALKEGLALEYAHLIEEGHWFTPTREAIDAFVASVQRRVAGSVRVELSRGSCRAVSCGVPQQNLGATAVLTPVDASPARGLEPVERSQGR